ncbi:hypothetical protein RHMOL_Rhmol09G0085300 [Rhododendron molle]|uniref:Uncharacterized protein n=1 Tax=Rhododendron molle TaxID=49168 RepID=A0ACC0MBI9_RHOML|nr:hypothetical protein RHMOL_Rhmol09G0085300 [Rhododendron molle]
MIWYVYYRTNKVRSDEIVTEYGGGVVINEDGFVFMVAQVAPTGYHKVLMKLPKDLDIMEMILVDRDISRNLAIYKPKGEKSQHEKSSNYFKFSDMNKVREGMQIFTTCHTGGLGLSFETREASYGATYDDREEDENESVFRTLKVQDVPDHNNNLLHSVIKQLCFLRNSVAPRMVITAKYTDFIPNLSSIDGSEMDEVKMTLN